MRFFFLILTFFGLSLGVRAQHDTVYTVSIVEVIDSSGKLPIEYEKLNELQKQSLRSSNIAELLDQDASVYIKSYGLGGLASPSFRGTAARHTQVVWNGVVLNSPMHAQADFSLFPNSLFSELSLHYGSGTINKRAGALGGAIHLNSNIEKERSLSFSHFRGSFGQENYQLNSSYSMGKNLTGETRVFTRIAENNFPFVNTELPGRPVDTLQNAALNQRGIIQAFSYDISENKSIDFHTWYQLSDREIPGTLLNNRGSGDQDDEEWRNILHFKSSSELFNWGLRLSYLSERIFFEEIRTGIASNNRVMFSRNDLYFSKKLNEANSIKTSINIDWSRANSPGFPNSPDRLLTGGNVEYSHSFSKRFKTDISLRQDLIDSELMPFSGSILNTLKIDDKGKSLVGLSVYRNYKAPSLNDLYWESGLSVGNPDLEAEKSLGGDFYLESKWLIKRKFRAKLKLNFYAMQVNNWIYWRPMNTGGWSAQNIGVVYNRGFGLKHNFSYHINREFELSSRLSYQFVRAQDVSRRGDFQLIFTPMHSLSADLGVRWKGFEARYNHRYLGSVYTDAQNSSSLEAFTLAMFFVRKELKLLRKHSVYASFRVNNLYNAAYRVMPARPMPGRNFEIGIQYEWR